MHQEGWHSVAQLNATLDRQRSKMVLVKTPLPRTKEWSDNPFLLNQKEGLFIISARISSTASTRYVGHCIGVECWNRQFIDVLDTCARPMKESEWKKLNIKDWQRTSAICIRD